MDYIAFPHNSFGVPLRKHHHPALGTMAEPLWSGDDVLAHSVGNVMAHGNLPRLHMSKSSIPSAFFGTFQASYPIPITHIIHFQIVAQIEKNLRPRVVM